MSICFRPNGLVRDWDWESLLSSSSCLTLLCFFPAGSGHLGAVLGAFPPVPAPPNVICTEKGSLGSSRHRSSATPGRLYVAGPRGGPPGRTGGPCGEGGHENGNRPSDMIHRDYIMDPYIQ